MLLSKYSRILISVFLLLILIPQAQANDIEDIKKAGVLKHLGIPYANFVTGLGDGLDVELMQGFADYLGVDYEYVPTTWKTAFGDLTGRHAKKSAEGGAEFLKTTKIKGDVLANGVTILPWRKEVVSFSNPTFPSGVWLVARAKSTLRPISPTSSINQDINKVKQALSGREVLALENTCLDPSLYALHKTDANIILANENLKLNEMAPAILNNSAETTLLDVPDALIALEKWHGELKVIGPISEKQQMGVAFRSSSSKLREKFNEYFEIIRKDGSYNKMVQKYYPTIFDYFEDFFVEQTN